MKQAIRTLLQQFRTYPITYLCIWGMSGGLIFLFHSFLFRFPPFLPDFAAFQQEAVPAWVKTEGEFMVSRLSNDDFSAHARFEGRIILTKDLFVLKPNHDVFAEDTDLPSEWWEYLQEVASSEGLENGRESPPLMDGIQLLSRVAIAKDGQANSYEQTLIHRGEWLFPKVPLPWKGKPRDAFNSNAVVLGTEKADQLLASYQKQVEAYITSQISVFEKEYNHLKEEDSELEQKLSAFNRQLDKLLPHKSWFIAEWKDQSDNRSNEMLLVIDRTENDLEMYFIDPLHPDVLGAKAQGNIMGLRREQYRIAEIKERMDALKAKGKQLYRIASLIDQNNKAPQPTAQESLLAFAGKEDYPIHAVWTPLTTEAFGGSGSLELGLTPNETGFEGASAMHQIRFHSPDTEQIEAIRNQALVQLNEKQTELKAERDQLLVKESRLKEELASLQTAQFGAIASGDRYQGDLTINGKEQNVTIRIETADQGSIQAYVIPDGSNAPMPISIYPSETEESLVITKALDTVGYELQLNTESLKTIEDEKEHWQRWQIIDEEPKRTEESPITDLELAPKKYYPLVGRIKTNRFGSTLPLEIAIEESAMTGKVNGTPFELQRVISTEVNSSDKPWNEIKEWCRKRKSYFIPEYESILSFISWEQGNSETARIALRLEHKNGSQRNYTALATYKLLSDGKETYQIKLDSPIYERHILFQWHQDDWHLTPPSFAEPLRAAIQLLRDSSTSAGIYFEHQDRLHLLNTVPPPENVSSEVNKIINGLFELGTNQSQLIVKSQWGYKTAHQAQWVNSPFTHFFVKSEDRISTITRYPISYSGDKESPWHVQRAQAESMTFTSKAWGDNSSELIFTTPDHCPRGTHLLKITTENQKHYYLLINVSG